MRDYLPWVGGGADGTHGRKCVKVTMVDISDMIRNREIIGTKRYLEKYQSSQNAGCVGEAKKSLLSVKVRAVILGEKSILLENESSENSKSYQ